MTRFDATGRRALWTSGQLGQADLTTSPQAQQQQQKRSIHMVHKPVNSVCYRHITEPVAASITDPAARCKVCGGTPRQARQSAARGPLASQAYNLRAAVLRPQQRLQPVAPALQGAALLWVRGIAVIDLRDAGFRVVQHLRDREPIDA